MDPKLLKMMREERKVEERNQLLMDKIPNKLLQG